MKKMNQYIQAFVFSGLAAWGLSSCEPKEYDSDEYDIQLPKAEITDFTPKTALVGSNITLTGNNLDDNLLRVFVGSMECAIVSQSANSVTVQLPRVITSSYLVTTNSYDARFETAEKFVPLYPETKIDTATLPDTIVKTDDYVITGENLDLLTEVKFSDTTIFIDGTKVTDPSRLVISAAEKNPAKAKFKAVETISFKSMAGNIMPSKGGIVVINDYPSSNLVVVYPNAAAKGSDVTFVFDNIENMSLITGITVGGKSAAFSVSGAVMTVTIPADAADGAIKITNRLGIELKYKNGTMLTVVEP